MSEPNDERSRDQRLDSGDEARREAAVVAGMTSMVVGLFPFAIISSLATGTGLFLSFCVTLWLGLMMAFPIGAYCGLIGWWLTRNSTIDSRLMACALAAILELTLLGWSIVIWA